MGQDVKSFLISLLANLATEGAKKAISALKSFKTRSEELEAIIQAKGTIEIAVSTGAISLDGAKLEALKSIGCDHGQGQIKVDRLVVFEDKKIRRIFHKGEWYFSIIDVVEVLTDSSNARRYWSDLKSQLVEKEGFSQLYEKIVQLKLVASDSVVAQFPRSSLAA